MLASALTLGRVVLRLPPGTGNPQHWRWRTERALSRVTLNAGMPPQSILVVRRLPDVAPGALLADDSLQRWNSAAQAWLRDCWRRAARPAFEPVSASAEAVWFADEAEWLACLSWDMHQNTAMSRWWWQTWLRQHRYDAVGAGLYNLWRSSPRWLPQAVALLYERYAGGLRTLFLRLSPAEARHIRQLVQQAYELPGVLESGGDILLEALPGDVQRAARDLPGEAAALLVLCLAVTRVPTALAQMRQAVRSHLPRAETTATRQSTAPIDPKSKRALAEDPPLLSSSATINPDLSESQASQPRQQSAAPVQHNKAPMHTNPKPNMPPETQTQANSDHPQIAQSSRHAAPSDSSPLSAPRVPDDAPDTGAADAIHSVAVQLPNVNELPELHSGLGGVWYLVNVLVDLEWPGPPLNAWHKLMWLARALLNDTPPDPVWGVLVALAGEEANEIALQDWLTVTRPIIETHLRERLEQPETLVEALRDSAGLYVTRTHIDVVFRLDQIRLDLRLAGLDRNPGWVPPLARIVTLHYE